MVKASAFCPRTRSLRAVVDRIELERNCPLRLLQPVSVFAVATVYHYLSGIHAITPYL